MSGHSKWSKIKHKKGALDAKRGKIFSKLTLGISVAARTGGSDPNFNPSLRLAIEQARSSNMPSANIERAIKKTTGQDQEKLEELFIEAYGSGGIALLIEAITDNKNRTINELKTLLIKYGGKTATEGSVLWLFKKFGKIIISSPQLKQEDLELLAIEVGAQDIKKEIINQEIKFVILTKPEELELIRTKLKQNNLILESVGFYFVAQTKISLNEEQKNKLKLLIKNLDEHDDVQEIYSNLTEV